MTALVVRSAFTVGPDGLLAVVALGMALLYARYLRTGRTSDGGWWLILALCGMTIHVRAVAFAMLPLWGVLIQRRAKTQPLYMILLAASLVVAGTVPALIELAADGSAASIAANSVMFPVRIVRVVGWPIALLAGVGLGATVWRSPRNPIAVA